MDGFREFVALRPECAWDWRGCSIGLPFEVVVERWQIDKPVNEANSVLAFGRDRDRLFQAVPV